MRGRERGAHDGALHRHHRPVATAVVKAVMAETTAETTAETAAVARAHTSERRSLPGELRPASL